MGDLSDFERGQIVGARLTGTSVTKTVRRELHKSNIHGRAATAKLLISESDAQMRKRWCHDHKA
jgi:hypothetical protein